MFRITFVMAPRIAPTTGPLICPIPCKIPVEVWQSARKIIETPPTVSSVPPSLALGNSMWIICGPSALIPTAAGTEIIMEMR